MGEVVKFRNKVMRFKVGKKSDGYTILKAFEPLINTGWSFNVSKGDKDSIKVVIYDPNNQNFAESEGNSFFVALRRLTEGFSQKFSNMQE